MLILEIVLGYIAISAMVLAFFGSMFAAYNNLTLNDPCMKLYKWCFRIGLVLLVIDLLIIICDALAFI